MKHKSIPDNPMQIKTFTSGHHGDNLSVEMNKFIETVHRVTLIRVYRDQNGWYGWVGYKPNKENNDEN